MVSSNRPTVGIIGRGFVGKATGLLFAKSRVLCYDKDESLCVPKGLTIQKLIKESQFVFICVPTPMEKGNTNMAGRCSLSIVENVKQEIDEAMSNVDYGDLEHVKPIIFLRSTVPPTTCNKLGLNFMPEFLTEANWENDTINAKRLYFGINSNNTDDNITNIKESIKWLVTMGTSSLPSESSNNTNYSQRECVFGTTTGMELFKMFANSFLAMKVGFCNEIYNYSMAIGGSHIYEEMCELVKEDKRIGSSHMKVPGPDGKFGFGGTCFPKDIHSLLYEFQSLNIEAPITTSVIKRNEEIDRPEKDWENSIGRAVI